MKKIAILLLTILFANPVYSMESTDNSTKKEMELDIDGDGITDIVVSQDTVGFDVDGDGKPDAKFSTAQLRKISKTLAIIAISTCTIDKLFQILKVPSPIDSLEFGELTDLIMFFLIDLVKTYGPKIIPFIKNNWSNFIEAFKELRAGMQKRGEF